MNPPHAKVSSALHETIPSGDPAANVVSRFSVSRACSEHPTAAAAAAPRLQLDKLQELRDARSVDEVEEENAWKELKRAQAVRMHGRNDRQMVTVCTRMILTCHHIVREPSLLC